MRVKEIDIARGFTVLIMPAVHVLLINSTISTQTSLLGKFFAFLAEGPGAQLFMLLMGMSFTFSAAKNSALAFKKTVILFSVAYCLNFLKFDIPMLFGFMPAKFLADLNLANNRAGLIQLFLVGDILHLAAISFVVLTLMYHLPRYYIWSALASLFIILLSPLNVQTHLGNALINHVFDLLFANDSYVFFPVFPWLCYPLTGLCLGHLIHTKSNFFSIVRNTGIVLMAAGKLLCFFKITPSSDNFYRPGPGDAIYHMGFVMLWLFLAHILIKYCPDNWFFNLLSWLSKKITVIYLLQWICIFWMINVGGYHQLSTSRSILYMAFITIFVFGLTYLIDNFLRITRKK